MQHNAYQLHTYTLVDTATEATVKMVRLTTQEALVLNYAYALNGSDLRYQRAYQNE